VGRDGKLDPLHSVPLFGRFDRKHLERLSMLTEGVDVPAGKVLIRQGELGDDLMIIVSGVVSVKRDGVKVNKLGPGEFFGEIALIRVRIPSPAPSPLSGRQWGPSLGAR
jgi:CRP-like cAMP-binding protein